MARIIPRCPLLTSPAMRSRNTKASQNVEDYRGRRTGGGGGGMKFGIVGLVAIVGAYFLGIDPRLVMGLLAAAPVRRKVSAFDRVRPPTKAANSSYTAWAIRETWTSYSSAGRSTSPAPRVVSDGLNTCCGSHLGPPDLSTPARQRYIDLAFFRH